MRLFNPRKLRYAKALDALGRWLFGLRALRRGAFAAPLQDLHPRRILVLESHLIGDIVMAIPALRGLRDRFPAAHLTLVAGPWAEELLEGQGLVDVFQPVRFPWATYDYSPAAITALVSSLGALREVSWDLAVDLRGDVRNIVYLYLTRAKRRLGYGFTGGEYLLTDVVADPPVRVHIVEYNAILAEALGCRNVARVPHLVVSDERRRSALSLLGARGIEPGDVVVGIHPGASKPLRHWREERFARVADMLARGDRVKVVLFQGPKDREDVARITGRMEESAVVMEEPLARLPPLFACCSVFLGLDSGAVHLAAAVGTPTVVLFGPAEPERVQPLSPATRIVIAPGFPCRPCDQVHCVQSDNTCMDALLVESVYRQVLLALGRDDAAGRGDSA